MLTRKLCWLLTVVASCAIAQTNVKISELPDATTPLSGAEVSPTVQSGVTKKFPLGLLAPKANPQFTGSPTAPTPAPGNNSTALATTAYVQSQNYLQSGTLTPCTDANCVIIGIGANILQAYTAPRTITLPLAGSVPNGMQVCIIDVVGAVTQTNFLTVQVAGSDVIDRLGAVNPSNMIIKSPPAICFVSNGSVNWTSRAALGAKTVLCNNEAVTAGVRDCSRDEIVALLAEIVPEPLLRCGVQNATGAVAASGGAGAGATQAITGTACAGIIVLTTAGIPLATSQLVQHSFNIVGNYVDDWYPMCTISASNAAAAQLFSTSQVVYTENAAGFKIFSGSVALTTATVYQWTYTCLPYGAR